MNNYEWIFIAIASKNSISVRTIAFFKRTQKNDAFRMEKNVGPNSSQKQAIQKKNIFMSLTVFPLFCPRATLAIRNFSQGNRSFALLLTNNKQISQKNLWANSRPCYKNTGITWITLSSISVLWCYDCPTLWLITWITFSTFSSISGA